MPPPSPALTRLEAERAARAAAAKSPPPEDSLSELEALRAKFDEVKRERDEAMAKVSELTDELEAATYSEEQVRALLAEALADLAERDDGDGEEAGTHTHIHTHTRGTNNEGMAQGRPAAAVRRWILNGSPPVAARRA